MIPYQPINPMLRSDGRLEARVASESPALASHERSKRERVQDEIIRNLKAERDELKLAVENLRRDSFNLRQELDKLSVPNVLHETIKSTRLNQEVERVQEQWRKPETVSMLIDGESSEQAQRVVQAGSRVSQEQEGQIEGRRPSRDPSSSKLAGERWRALGISRATYYRRLKRKR